MHRMPPLLSQLRYTLQKLPTHSLHLQAASRVPHSVPASQVPKGINPEKVFAALVSTVAVGSVLHDIVHANPDTDLKDLPRDDYDRLPKSLKAGRWGLIKEGTSKTEFYRIKAQVDQILIAHDFPMTHVAFLDRLGVLRIDKVEKGSSLHKELDAFAKANGLEILYEDAKGKLKISLGKFTKKTLCEHLYKMDLLTPNTIAIGDQMHITSMGVPAADLDMVLGLKQVKHPKGMTHGYNVGPTLYPDDPSVTNSKIEHQKTGPEATLAILKKHLEVSRQYRSTFTFCLDVDNTLINPGEPLSKELKTVMKELLESGNRIILVTVGSFTQKLDMFADLADSVKVLPSKSVELHIANISGTVVRARQPFFRS